MSIEASYEMESLAGSDSRESLQDNRNDCHTASSVPEFLPIRDVFANPETLVTYHREEGATKRGRDMLVDSEGYSYNIAKEKNGVTYWQCTFRPKENPCKAKVREEAGTFRAVEHRHNHEPKAKKTKAVKKKFKPAKAIVHEEPLSEGHSDSGFETSHNLGAQNLKEVKSSYYGDVFINPTESGLKGGVPCAFNFTRELPSSVEVQAIFYGSRTLNLHRTSYGYVCLIPDAPKMEPGVFPVKLISKKTGRILAETSLTYLEARNEQKNLGGKPGASGRGRGEDGDNEGGGS